MATKKEAPPPSQERDVLLDHDYDGIQEYDNPLPSWWLAMFYAGIIFGIFYVPWYHFGPGPLMKEELAMELAEAHQQAAALAAASGEVDDSDPYEGMIGDDERIARGKPKFESLCAACHAADGGGLVGPNLTDNHWKNGGRMKDIVRVVTRGVPGTAMVSWTAQLSEEEIVDVAVFIKSLKGTTPANPKDPEGVEFND